MHNGKRFAPPTVLIILSILLSSCTFQSGAYGAVKRSESVMPSLLAFTEYRELRMTVRHESDNGYYKDDSRSYNECATLRDGIFKVTDTAKTYVVHRESDGVIPEYLPPVIPQDAVESAALAYRDGYQDVTLTLDTDSLLAYFEPMLALLFMEFGLPEDTAVTDIGDTVFTANYDRSQGYCKTASLLFTGNICYRGAVCPVTVYIGFDYTDVSYPV